MGLPVEIKDGNGTGQKAGVNGDGALQVASLPLPLADLPDSVTTRQKLLTAQFLTPAGSALMNVAGTLAVPIDFSISGESGKVKVITGFRLILNSTRMSMATTEIRQFGPAAVAPGLTNGILLYAAQGGNVVQYFVTPVKNIGDFLDYNMAPFVNILDAISAGVDYLAFDFVLPVPVVLPSGTLDSLTISIRDNLTTIASFTAIARGYQEF